MGEHPVRLVVSDNLERNRLTVFFRLLLAIPHYFWLGLWGVAAVAAAVLNWFATLARGRSPSGLHRFLAAYVKYATQLYAYVYLAANPYPPFDGRDGYPVDVAIAAPQRQSRWRVAFRIVLIVPAAIFATSLLGAPGWAYTSRRASYGNSYSHLLLVVAVLAWFAVLARGRMPRGLRDAAAYCLAYGAQLWAYAFVLTDRYPNSDPRVVLPQLPECDHPVWLSLDDDLARSRLTVFFRLLLAIPHLIWLTLWSVLALLAAIANWLAVLVTSRVPAPLGRFLRAYLRYQFHVYGFLLLVANPFPGFVGAQGSYPLEAHIAIPERQRRWKVLLRLPLALPALALGGAYGTVYTLAAVLGWFASLATGRMPRGLRNAAALALRYHLQAGAYLYVLCEVYPYTGPCAQDGAPERQPFLPPPAVAV
jgi:Domain of unknown function (DUF4389)